MEQVAAVFSQHSDDVLLLATNPLRRGCIQRTFKFPPSLQEISEALDGAEKTARALAWVEERESRGFRRGDSGGWVNAAGEKYDPRKHGDLSMIEVVR